MYLIPTIGTVEAQLSYRMAVRVHKPDIVLYYMHMILTKAALMGGDSPTQDVGSCVLKP